MASIFKRKHAPTDDEGIAKSKVLAGSKYMVGLLALLVAGLITIFAVAAIAVASKHTKELLGCRQRLANSSNATEQDKIRVAELQENIWVILPKWALALTMGLVGLLTYAALSITLIVTFLHIRQKLLSFLRTTNKS